MNRHFSHFDGPFWVALVAGVFLVGSFGCIILAAAAQGAARTEPTLVTVDNS